MSYWIDPEEARKKIREETERKIKEDMQRNIAEVNASSGKWGWGSDHPAAINAEKNRREQLERERREEQERRSRR